MNEYGVRGATKSAKKGLSAGLALVSVIVVSFANVAFADTITGFIYDNTSYSQTSNAAPTSPSGYFFSIGATFDTAGDFYSAGASYPGPGTPQSLPLNGTEFNFTSPYYSSLSALHTHYGFGKYVITATGPVLQQTSAVPYAGDYFTSTVPYVTDFSSLDGLDPAANFTATYDSFIPNPSVSEGFTFFTIYDESTGAAVFSDGFQSPSSISALVPAGTLLADTDYTYELDFSDRLDGTDNADGGTYTEQGFDMRTDGSFTTGAVSVPEPSSLTLLLGAGLAALAVRRWKRRDA
ncbi:MAG: PEP-CTERM sorting domain-containing protein [Steroidobacteraceae bacterium]